MLISVDYAQRRRCCCVWYLCVSISSAFLLSFCLPFYHCLVIFNVNAIISFIYLFFTLFEKMSSCRMNTFSTNLISLGSGNRILFLLFSELIKGENGFDGTKVRKRKFLVCFPFFTSKNEKHRNEKKKTFFYHNDSSYFQMTISTVCASGMKSAYMTSFQIPFHVVRLILYFFYSTYLVHSHFSAYCIFQNIILLYLSGFFFAFYVIFFSHSFSLGL